MRNPYTKTAISDGLLEGRFRGQTDRWAYFEVSGGVLWGSPTRRKGHGEKCRDYCHAVFERWARRFKVFLPLPRQHNFLIRKMRRYDWFSRAGASYLIQLQYEVLADGPFTYISYWDGEGNLHTCPFCKAPAFYARPGDEKSDVLSMVHAVSLNNRLPQHCCNPVCVSVRQYEKRKGDIAERAKNAGVALGIPHKALAEAPDPDTRSALLLAAALRVEAAIAAKSVAAAKRLTK